MLQIPNRKAQHRLFENSGSNLISTREAFVLLHWMHQWQSVKNLWSETNKDCKEITPLLFGWTQRGELLNYLFYKNKGWPQLLTYDEKKKRIEKEGKF